jgi:Ala-tRNA(Pro) deacylase
MAMPARLKEHLQQAHAFYIQVPHAPARSSQYAASLLHVPGKEVAKSVAIRAGKQVFLAVLPASDHINAAKLSSLVGAPVTLLTEEECYQRFPDCQHGAVPPFGELYGLPVILDESLVEAPEIVFSAGTLSDGIRMGNADFVHLVKPRICSFAESGEATHKGEMQDIFDPERGGGK